MNKWTNVPACRGRTALLACYSSPCQRKTCWTAADQHLHKDWGDMFFDLLYVAAAYNLGNLLRNDPTWQGVLYFVALFFPLVVLWNGKLIHDCRYGRKKDCGVQTGLETLSWMATATAVQHTGTVSQLSAVDRSVTMFGFSLSIAVGFFFLLVRNVEILWFADKNYTANQESHKEEAHENPHADHHNGHDDHHDQLFPLDHTARTSSQYDIGATVCGLVPVTAAAIYSGRQFFGSTSLQRNLADETNYETGSDESDDIAAWLLIATFVFFFSYYCAVVVGFYVMKRDWKSLLVPMNLTYVIHRTGEWTMLMLGETVLSLLVVDYTDTREYYLTFYCGVVTIVLLEYLHFRSQPSTSEEHAMHRGLGPGLSSVLLSFLYSSALIILGASYKMLLYEFKYEKKDASSLYGVYDEGNYTDMAGNYSSTTEDTSHHRSVLEMLVPGSRMLAGTSSAALRFDTDERRQRIAIFFAGSMAACWALLDLLSVVHAGVMAPKNTMLGVLCVARGGLVVWMATLPIYVTTPEVLALFAMIGVILQLILRAVHYYFSPKDEEQEMNLALERDLGYTAARLRGPSVPIE